jgi:serine/threonine-protein kinase/endoribonuclease IRE1
MLISDFGLCKKLDLDQTSFLPTAHGAMGAGTFGWRAPEILRGEVKLDNSEDTSSSKGSAGTINGNPSSISSNSSTASNSRDKPTRLTKSVDIFALGCLFYYMLTAGGHPFGDRFEREVNIIKGVKDLKGLEERYGEEGVDAADLIEGMLNAVSSQRYVALSYLFRSSLMPVSTAGLIRRHVFYTRSSGILVGGSTSFRRPRIALRLCAATPRTYI